jgi:hypothetical protein
MMTALVARWNLGSDLYRSTGDADFGIPPLVLRNIELTERLSSRGYKRVAGDRFEKPVLDVAAGFGSQDEVHVASIDVLIPAYTSRARNDRKVGDSIVATEALGLADALLRPGVAMDLTMRRLNEEELRASLLFPDEVSSLLLKLGAIRERSKDTDVVDLWRCLEVCNAAQLGPQDFAEGACGDAATKVRELFAAREGAGMAAIMSAQNLSTHGRDARFTRIAALMDRLFG